MAKKGVPNNNLGFLKQMSNYVSIKLEKAKLAMGCHHIPFNGGK